MTMASASHLREHVESILRKMGCEPVPGVDGQFVKKSKLDQPLSLTFYTVTNQDVRKFTLCKPSVTVPHARFVTDHVKYLWT